MRFGAPPRSILFRNCCLRGGTGHTSPINDMHRVSKAQPGTPRDDKQHQQDTALFSYAVDGAENEQIVQIFCTAFCF